MQGISLTPQQVFQDWDFESLHWLKYLRIIEFIDVSPLAAGVSIRY